MITKNPFNQALNPGLKPEQANQLLNSFGAHYYPAGFTGIHAAGKDDTYFYEVFIGKYGVCAGDFESVWSICVEEDGTVEDAFVRPGHTNEDGSEALILSDRFAVKMAGLKYPRATVAVPKSTVLPYVNGCSTRQLIPAQRVGDPTLQYLLIPPYSAEQAHHIHSTVRAVYVVSGKGVSVVGMDKGEVRTELLPGMVCVLDPMCPHHFETPQGEPLRVIPFHVWSSPPGESNHPMFRGTHLMNQGE